MSAGDIDFFLIKFTFPYSVDAVVMGALQLSFSLLQFDRDEFQEPPFRIFHVKRLWHLTVSQPPEVGSGVIVRAARASV